MDFGVDRLYNIIRAEVYDIYFMQRAISNAQKSKDRSTQNGSVLVPADVVLVTNNFGKHFPSGGVADAHNGIPTRFGVKSSEKRLNDRPLKYQVAEHAEDGACFCAARLGIKTEGSTLYCPWYSCSKCAIAIICSGIKKVVGHTTMMRNTPDRWIEDVELGFQLLKEAGVDCVCIDEPMGMKLKMNGENIAI